MKRASTELTPPVGDLEVAAAYAVSTASNVSLSATIKDEGNNQDEIELEEEDLEDDDEDEADTKPENPVVVKQCLDDDYDDEHDDDHDHDGSDHDLEEELRAMTVQQAAAAKRTQHEVDPYQASRDELQAFGLELDVDGNIRGALGVAGRILRRVHRTVVVQGTEEATLQEGTILVIQPDNHPVALGRILEVFGPVREPLYSIRLVDNEPDPWDVNGQYANVLQSNLPVYYSKNEASLITPQTLLRDKGTDASNEFDEEERELLYYSDDEEEQRSRASRRRGARTSSRAQPTGFFAVPTVPAAPAMATAVAPQQPPPPPQDEEESDTVYF